MSMTYSDRVTHEGAAYGGFADAIGGIAAIVLAIVGLSGARPEMMVAIATIVFGGALLIQGGAIASEYAHIMFPAGAGPVAIEEFGGSSLSALFLAGAAGIVLGVLALLGIASAILTSVSIIAFGAALLLSSNAVSRLQSLKRVLVAAEGRTLSGSAILANEIASGSSGVHWLAGLTAIVLGVLAVAGVNPVVLTLSALIVLGATLVLSGSSLSATVMSFMRPAARA